MNCLNCNSEASGSYCYNCGQKTSTTRFSFKQIFKNDIASTFYAFFKSELFFTIKELFTRPGHSVREYLAGKRVNHMNYMSLFILLSAIGIFLDKYAKVSMAALSAEDKASEKIMVNYFNFVRDNPKTFIFITIPIISAFTYLFFKKSKFNFPEHLIMNVYKASALLILSKIVTLFSILSSNIALLKFVDQLVSYGTTGYSIWFLYQFFYDSKLYSKAVLIIRSTVAVLFGLLFSTIFMFIYWLIYFALEGGKIS
ncbi:DUF3667 domain-containing protein [Flavobacterium sp. RSSA_27]|uniref:DUF3667 domain-containing protein n=1 Tax=Flavobacterium sp. RSSA_27 TaxID=3447667 RepID=UPI003F409EA2